MSIQTEIAGALLVAGIVAGGVLWHQHEVSIVRTAARQAGYDAAVAAGEKQRATDAAAALTTERALRAKLATADAAALKLENEHAETLAAAQRRIRNGADSLRIAVNTIRATATAADGPAAGGPAPDGVGAAVVPEVAAAVLGLAADTGRLVRKYQRLTERHDECVALNNGTAQAAGNAAD